MYIYIYIVHVSNKQIGVDSFMRLGTMAAASTSNKAGHGMSNKELATKPVEVEGFFAVYPMISNVWDTFVTLQDLNHCQHRSFKVGRVVFW